MKAGVEIKSVRVRVRVRRPDGKSDSRCGASQKQLRSETACQTDEAADKTLSSSSPSLVRTFVSSFLFATSAS